MRTVLRLLLTLILLSAASFTSSAAAPDSITVSGRVVGIAEDGRRSLIINECDLYQKSAREFVELDSAGSFDAKVPFSSGHTFTIVYNRTFINAYAEPGESIRIEIDASVSPFTFTMSGDHGKLNDELAHAHEDLKKIYYGINLPSPKTPFDEYMPAFKSIVKDKQSIVDAYIVANGLSDETADMLRIDNLFTIANSACDYTGASKEDEYAFFTDSFFDIYNEENARLMIFPSHLSALCYHCPEIIDHMPKGKIRDLMYVSMSEDTIPLRDDFADTAYFDRVFGKEEVKIDLSRVKPSDLLVYRNGAVESVDGKQAIEWLREAYPGKPIYLDICATWCGPCLSSLANSEDVRAHFKDKDVVLAVLWLKSDKESWSELVPSITNAVHIFVSDDGISDAIMGAFNLEGFPSCYLIGCNGTIYSEDIPRFHNPAIYEFLNKAISEQ